MIKFSFTKSSTVADVDLLWVVTTSCVRYSILNQLFSEGVHRNYIHIKFVLYHWNNSTLFFLGWNNYFDWINR